MPSASTLLNEASAIQILTKLENGLYEAMNKTSVKNKSGNNNPLVKNILNSVIYVTKMTLMERHNKFDFKLFQASLRNDEIKELGSYKSSKEKKLYLSKDFEAELNYDKLELEVSMPKNFT